MYFRRVIPVLLVIGDRHMYISNDNLNAAHDETFFNMTNLTYKLYRYNDSNYFNISTV